GRAVVGALVECADLPSGRGHARVLGAPSRSCADRGAVDRALARAAPRLQRDAALDVRAERARRALPRLYADAPSRRRVRCRPCVRVRAVSSCADPSRPGPCELLDTRVSRRVASVRRRRALEVGVDRCDRVADAGAVVRVLFLFSVHAARAVLVWFAVGRWPARRVLTLTIVWIVAALPLVPVLRGYQTILRDTYGF